MIEHAWGNITGATFNYELNIKWSLKELAIAAAKKRSRSTNEKAALAAMQLLGRGLFGVVLLVEVDDLLNVVL